MLGYLLQIGVCVTHVRRQTVAMFGFSTQRGMGEVSPRDIADLPNKIAMATSQFEVTSIAPVPQRKREQDTDIVTCSIRLKGHVTGPVLERVLEGVRRSNPQRAYAFSDVTILPIGANPNIHQH